MTTFKRIRKTEDLQHYAITVNCMMCGQDHEVIITAGEMFLLNQGLLISQACKDESAETRESLISGMCPKCQNEFFI